MAVVMMTALWMLTLILLSFFLPSVAYFFYFQRTSADIMGAACLLLGVTWWMKAEGCKWFLWLALVFLESLSVSRHCWLRNTLCIWGEGHTGFWFVDIHNYICNYTETNKLSEVLKTFEILLYYLSAANAFQSLSGYVTGCTLLRHLSIQ